MTSPPSPTSPKRGPRRRGSRQGEPRVPVVAIGASAGGLEAYERFFSRVPPDCGISFVLVPHLDTQHKSAMAELLRRYTQLPVIEIIDGMPAEINRVHIIPPNATLGMEQGRFQVRTPRADGLTIDAFFRSLAADQRESAVAIILSGSGSDGAVGLKAIKERGGLTMAQAGESARYDSMPRSAAATGLIDFVLPVEDMPARLVEHARHLAKRNGDKGANGLHHDARAHLTRIHTILRTRTGHDFSKYKDNTFIRRVQRRMQLAQISSASDYVELLRKEPGEADALFRDLLIGVTHFFRDPAAYEILAREVIPKLVEGKTASDQVRVWVPGCATGEEAYSIAILLHEETMRANALPKVQIFATDIDDEAIAQARSGLYSDAIARDLSRDRLERFFVRDGSNYRVVKEIRELCVFSVHNLIASAPFSRLDLISCRNLLIYFDSELQSRVLSLFHFALRQRGYLFLGPSENVTHKSKLFSRIDAKARIFKARTTELGRTPNFPLTSPPFRQTPEGEGRAPHPTLQETMNRRIHRIVDSYAPACVVVDDHYEILHFCGRTGRYLQPSPGAASLNLFSILDASLRPDLRTIVNSAIASGKKVVHENVLLAAGSGAVQPINLIAEPIIDADGEQRLCAVIFQEVGPQRSRETISRDGATDAQKDEIIQTLEAELLATRERLQTMIEELETSNEEMKSSNEEFQSVNEELQSTNEELETSKEELQSVNEELETVNAELNAKVESLDRANSDRKNLLESTQIATMFLDNDLRVKSFTPAITEIFRLIDTDQGRPITDIVKRVELEDLPSVVSRVLRTLTREEHEVPALSGDASYLMRILPYRTVDNVIDGVVVTFIDITERKRSEDYSARLAAIVRTSNDAIIGLTPAGVITTWNGGAERMYGYAESEALGRQLGMLMPREAPQEAEGLLRRLESTLDVVQWEGERIGKDAARIHVSSAVSPIRDSSGKLIAAAAIERDVSERRAAELRQNTLVGELNHRVKNTLAAVTSIAATTLQSSPSLEIFADKFNGRIRALASTHDLLVANAWMGADLKQVFQFELAPFEGDGGAVRMEGEPIFISPRAAVTLGMAVYELATNAAKYGALSTSAGRLRIGWRVDPSTKMLAIEWQERGGPAIERQPRREGFGLNFIERSLAHDLGATVEMAFNRDGFSCRIDLPSEELEA